MNAYFYRDKSQQSGKIVFECQADNILEADGLYRVTLGKDPSKERYVACEVVVPDSPKAAL